MCLAVPVMRTYVVALGSTVQLYCLALLVLSELCAQVSSAKDDRLVGREAGRVVVCASTMASSVHRSL
ncbi:hypothetical protein AKJ16_DCAP08068 [Drosera capensis]